MPENRTISEQIEVQRAKIASEQAKLEELLVRQKTEHSDDNKAHDKLLIECGRLIEQRLNRPLTKDDVFKFERFLQSQSLKTFFPEWMNKQLNKKGKESNDTNKQ